MNSGSWVGGLIGLNYATLSNSYNQGDVCASGNYNDGVAGINGTNGAVTNVYTTGLVSGGWPVCDNTAAGSSLSNVYYLGSPQGDGIGSNLGTGIPVNLCSSRRNGISFVNPGDRDKADHFHSLVRRPPRRYYLDSCPAGGIGFNEGANWSPGRSR